MKSPKPRKYTVTEVFKEHTPEEEAELKKQIAKLKYDIAMRHRNNNTELKKEA